MYKIFVHTLTLNFHYLLIDVVKFGMYVETRTILRRIVSMSVDSAMINPGEPGEQLQQCRALLRSASVARCSISVQSSDVGNANAVRVVSKTVCAGLANSPSPTDCAINLHDIVISYFAPAASFMHAINVSNSKFLSSPRSCTMYYNIVDVARHKGI